MSLTRGTEDGLWCDVLVTSETELSRRRERGGRGGGGKLLSRLAAGVGAGVEGMEGEGLTDAVDDRLRGAHDIAPGDWFPPATFDVRR